MEHEFLYFDNDIIIVENANLLPSPNLVKPNYNLLVICRSGSMQTFVDGKPFELSEHQCMVAPSETIFSDIRMSDDFRFVALLISNNVLQGLLRNYINLWNQFVYIQGNRIVKAANGQTPFFDQVYDFFHFCLNAHKIKGSKKSFDSLLNKEIVYSFVRASLLGFCQRLKAESDIVFPQRKRTRFHDQISTLAARGTSPRSRSLALFNRFLNLLQEATVKYKPVEYYAELLCVTPKYLSVVCRRHSEKTAIEWIRQYTLADVNYYLRHTDLSMKELSDKLGFFNASFFSKYIRFYLNASPSQIRYKQ